MENSIIAPKPTDPKGPWDVIVIGSGPSGLTSAIYMTRGAASTLILGGEVWGGQLMLTTKVDNFPGFPEGIDGPELMARMRAQAERFGAEFVAANVTSINASKKPFEVTAGGTTYLTRSIIIATGANTTWLDVPGVKELIGHGVSSCAPCDAPFFRDKKVAVVGGGDSAMEEASVLTKYASEVTIIHRREEFRATAAMQEKIKSNLKIKIMWNSEVEKAIGEAKLEKLSIKNNITGEITEVPFDGLFVAIGHKPASDVFEGIIDRDDKGYISPVNWHCGTSVPGIFVAGDVMDKYFKQAVVSTGMGCIAAMETLKYLEEDR
jgi:thioredoxin reductase (NADPH)